ncbi:hypothetical protein Ahy_A03g013659 [Arachis hypogaea]|uniref:Uncharacterized protein n=1 Tax=Arachis hypogaea TaxID=3818 RepID=A0A445DVW3_ARAHY|nr:hypothetical protein Ahy_A03g013659 [Arachis hypogaea]
MQLGKMSRVGRFTKKARVDTTCQHPQVGFDAASSLQRPNCPISLPSGSGIPASSSLRPFRPPRSEPLPAPQACTNDVQNSKPDAKDLDPEADEVKLSVKEAIKPPNGRKIVLRFNSALQPVEDEAGLLSGVMGLLGSDYTEFPICEKDWRKVHTRDKVYNECVKEIFHFEEDSRGIIKRIIFKMLGRAWKETRNRLYHHCYDPEISLEENIENRPDEITTDHWKWSCVRKILRIDQSSVTPTPAGRKAWQGSEKKRKELMLLSNVMNPLDCCLRMIRLLKLSEKEHPGRVCGMGLGPTSSQVFSINSHQPSNGFEREETQRMLLELQAELAAEKLKGKTVEDEVAVENTKRLTVEDEVGAKKTKRQAVEDVVATRKVRMQAMESALICLLQGQGRKLPSDVAAWMSMLERQNRK